MTPGWQYADDNDPQVFWQALRRLLFCLACGFTTGLVALIVLDWSMGERDRATEMAATTLRNGAVVLSGYVSYRIARAIVMSKLADEQAPQEEIMPNRFLQLDDLMEGREYAIVAVRPNTQRVQWEGTFRGFKGHRGTLLVRLETSDDTVQEIWSTQIRAAWELD